jgi:WD40 repeat-containing protein SMU1
LFRGGRRETKEQDDKPPSKQAGVLKFGDKNHAECAMFSMDGGMLVTGSVDGLVEAWDFERCRWRQDLAYQVPIMP